MPMGFPGDSDPRDEEPEYECKECGDLLEMDLLQEWFCPSCEKAEQDK